MRILLSLAILCSLAATASAICDLPPYRGPSGEADPGARTPTDEPPDTPETTPTPPPEENPAPDPTPTPDPGKPPRGDPPPEGGSGHGPRASPPTGPGGEGRTATGRPNRRRTGPNYRSSWHIWWELNREYLFGLRKFEALTRDPEDTSSGVDVVAAYRGRTRRTLRQVALEPGENTELRATALRALGRAGTPEDAETLLHELLTPSRPSEIRESAAIGLASLRGIRDAKLRQEIRAGFTKAIRRGEDLKGRTQNIAILACGLRARDDEFLAKALLDRLRAGVKSGNEATALLFGSGISRCDLLTGDLTRVAETGRLGTRNVHDLARAHCVLGLAMCGGAESAPTLTKLLVAPDVGVDTRRSTALALGLLLREGRLDGVSDRFLQKALVHCFEEENDQLVKGYCAIAMGAARKPFLLNQLTRLLERTGSSTVKPYAALALGLAARTLGGTEATKIGRILINRLRVERDLDLVGAISIALGLARAEEAREILLERAANRKLAGSARGPACEALGLLKRDTPEVVDLLRKASDDGDVHVSLHALLALGFLGKSGTGPVLVEKLVETKAPAVRVHLVVALSHLGGIEALDPLLEVLGSRKWDHRIRASAASAIGILLDPRARDPLFEIDAYANPYGLTVATRELVRIY